MRRGVLIAVLVIGAALRAAALPLPGTVDVGSWKIWSFTAATDPAGLYGVGGTPPERRVLKWSGGATTVDYPPLALYELAIVGRLYWIVDPMYRDSPALTALVKAPGILAEVLFVGILLTWGRRRFGEAAEWTALAFWLNPAVILNGAVLGYLDAQMAVPAALALLAASARQSAAGALAICAVLTKAQAIFALPAIAVEVFRRRESKRDLIRAAAWAAVAAVLVLLPIALRGAWPNMLQAIGRLATHDMLSGYNLNVWWIVTWIVRAIDSPELGVIGALTAPVRILRITDFLRLYPDPRPIGTALVAASILWACWRSRRAVSVSQTALLGAWCVYAYTMFATRVHENHLYLAVPFMMIAAGLDRTLRPLAWALSAIAAINLYMFYGLGGGWPPIVGRGWTGIDLTVLLSMINVGIFAWATNALRRST
jgi:hypothetical protein